MRAQKQHGSFWLSAIFILVIVGLIAVLIAPVLTDVQSIASKFGFKSRTELKQDVKKITNSLDIAVDENKFLVEKVEKQAATNTAAVTAVDARHKAESSLDKQTSQIKQLRKQKIDALDTKYKDKPKTQLSEERKSQEVAVVHIASIWSAYCSFNSDPNCSEANTKS